MATSPPVQDLTAQTTITEAQHPTFVSLAPELRNRIYDFALVLAPPVHLSEFVKSPEPGLLQTCKQIRSEALNLYYDNIRISVGSELREIYYGDGSVTYGRTFDQLELLGRKRCGKIKTFTIELSALEPDRIFTRFDDRSFLNGFLGDQQTVDFWLHCHLLKPTRRYGSSIQAVFARLYFAGVKTDAIELPEPRCVEVGMQVRDAWQFRYRGVMRKELDYLKSQSR